MQNILIVDASEASLQTTRTWLEAAGYGVFGSMDWTDIPRILSRNEIAVVLLAVDLPGLSGDQLVSHLGIAGRKRPRVILHAAMEGHQLRSMAHRVGSHGWFCKGWAPELLVQAVGAAAKDFQAGLPPPPRPQSVPPRPPSVPPRPPGAAARPGPAVHSSAVPERDPSTGA